MKLKFSDEALKVTKQKIYPSAQDCRIKSISLNNSGTKTFADIAINITDTVDDSKIFNNRYSKKYLKLKIFEILDENVINEFKKTTSIEQINALILKYKLNFIDITPSEEFIGDKKDISEHFQQNNKIDLLYKKNLYFSKENINFISIGMCLFLDKQQMAQDQSSSLLTIPAGMFIDQIKIYPIVSSDSRSFQGAIIQDLRTIKKIFKENEFLVKLNESLETNIKFVKNFSNTNTKLKDNQYFSNAFFSRDTYGNLNFIFSLDYNRLIRNNSNYKKLISNTAYPEDIYNNTYISSLKVIRKKVRQNEKNKTFFEYDYDKQELVVASSSAVNHKKLYPINDNNSFIEEVYLDTNYRTFNVCDKTILKQSNYKNKNIFYKYGISLVVRDAYVEYLKNLKYKLNVNFLYLKRYFNETKKIVKLRNNGFLPLNVGYYNTLNNNFTTYFINTIFPRFHKKNLNTMINYMIGVLETIGLFKENYKPNSDDLFRYFSFSYDKRVEKQILLDSLTSLLNPNTASTESISYFMKIYESLLLFFDKLIKNNTNTTYQLDYWFKNEYISLSDEINTGYDFFNVSKQPGLSIIGQNFYRQKILKDEQIYVASNKIGNNHYSNVAPSIIKIGNKSFFLSDYYEKYINKDYSILEIDVKNYNNKILPNEKQTDYISENANLTPQQDKFIESCKDLLINNSVVIDDTSENFYSDNLNTRKFGSRAIKSTNKIDSSTLLLQISKFMTNNTLFVNNKTKKNFYYIVSEDPDFRTVTDKNMPYHIYSLIQKRTKIVDMDKFMIDSEENSKFLFFFNTIHKVQICYFNNSNIKQEKWEYLNQDIIDSLDLNKTYLCRLVLYQNSQMCINQFDDIKLPIFDKYFLFKKTYNNSNKPLNFFYSFIPTTKNIIPVIKPFSGYLPNNSTLSLYATDLLGQNNLNTARTEIDVSNKLVNLTNEEKFNKTQNINIGEVSVIGKDTLKSINSVSTALEHTNFNEINAYSSFTYQDNFKPTREFTQIDHFNKINEQQSVQNTLIPPAKTFASSKQPLNNSISNTFNLYSMK